MKKFYPYLNLLILAACLCFVSCQKQLRWPDEPGNPVNKLFAPTNCKPAVFGMNSASWLAFAQKWYVNSKVSFLKTQMSAAGEEPELNIDWGQLYYESNQVYLRDVQHNNDIVMRATIDNQGRAVASYFYNQTGNASNAFHYDTTYYYYTGQRLDSTVSIYQTQTANGTAPLNAWQKFKFSYDAYGSIAKIEGFPGLQQMNFQYDYTKPVAGIISNFHLTTPMKLMEFMELIKLPMRHALGKLELSQNGAVLMQQQFQDYQINSAGLVYSCTVNDGGNSYALYNGWECGTVNSPMNGSGRQQGIMSLDEFRQVYPFTK